MTDLQVQTYAGPLDLIQAVRVDYTDQDSLDGILTWLGGRGWLSRPTDSPGLAPLLWLESGGLTGAVAHEWWVIRWAPGHFTVMNPQQFAVEFLPVREDYATRLVDRSRLHPSYDGIESAGSGTGSREWAERNLADYAATDAAERELVRRYRIDTPWESA